MNDPSLKNRWILALFALALLTVSLSLHLRLIEYADDDAYIHMRVARNLWLYGEPYFTRGEPVMASTSPLWILLTSPAAAGGSYQPTIVAWLNAVFLCVVAIVWGAAYVAVTGSSRLWERLTASLLAFFIVAPSSLGLMETPCAMFLVGLGLWGVCGGRWWGLPAAVLSFFVRPECAVFGIAAVALKVLRRQPWSARELASATVVGISMLSFQLFEYGSILPHTAHVKAIVYDVTGREFARSLFVSGYGEWIAKVVLPYTIALVVVFSVVRILTSKGAPGKPRIPSSVLMNGVSISLLFPAIVIIATYAVRHVLVFPWYAPLYLLPLSLAVIRLGAQGERIISVLLVAPLGFLAFLVLGSLLSPSKLPFFESGARARQLKAVGTSLAQEFPNATMMAPEIGALGFVFPGRVIDSIGLASPAALSYHPLRVPDQRPSGAHGGVPAAFVAAEKPDLVVGLDSFMQDFLKSDVSRSYDIRRLPPFESSDAVCADTARVFGATTLIVAVHKK